MKRYISLVLCIALVFSLCSCSNNILTKITEQMVAVKYASANELAADEFVQQGYSKVTYTSSEDVIVAVENGKVQYGIVDELEYSSYISAGRSIKKSQVCEYSLDYCAYFAADNTTLQQEFDDAIEALQQNGTLAKIKEYALNGKSYSITQKSVENGTITMLCDPSFKNRLCTDENGNIVGVDVDIAYAICNYIGYSLKIVTVDFDELFYKLQKGEGDFIISACEVNTERENYYLLSDSYLTLNYYLIERK